MGRESDDIISLTFGDLERSVEKHGFSVRDNNTFLEKILFIQISSASL